MIKKFKLIDCTTIHICINLITFVQSQFVTNWFITFTDKQIRSVKLTCLSNYV